MSPDIAIERDLSGESGQGNNREELHPILGDFVRRYGTVEVPNLWYYSNWRMALVHEC